MNQKNKVAYIGVLSALAVILGYVETLIPVFMGIPGMKLGLANIAILSLLYLYGWKTAAFISLIRILLIGFLFTNLYSILYSLAGAALSLLLMTLLKKTDLFSIYAVSAAGGVSHNIGQLFIAAVIVETASVMYYLPVLLISGTVTGILIGLMGAYIQKRLLVIAQNHTH